MAVGVAIAGMVQSQRASRQAKRATAQGVEAQRLTSEEEIRRKKYAHKRDISDIEAEMAGMGIEDPSLRREGTDTRFDTEISSLEKTIAEKEQFNKELSGKGYYATRANRYGNTRFKSIGEDTSKLAELKERRKTEVIPWDTKQGGMFAKYLAEKEKVHYDEINWMKKTGLSQVASIQTKGKSAQLQAQSQMVSSFGKLGTAAGWWT